MKFLTSIILCLSLIMIISNVNAQYQKAWEVNGKLSFGGVANVDNDPEMEMVFVVDGKVTVYNSVTGSIEWESYHFGDALSSIQLINIDNDNKSEILAYCYYSYDTQKYVLYYYDDIGDISSNEEPGFKSMNYPNPYQTSTTIEYDIPEKNEVVITIYNEKGSVVNTINLGTQTKGMQHYKWNCQDNKNAPVKPGVYFYTITSGKYTSKQKMVKI